MTWGQVENTPVRLSGPEYQMPATPAREEVLNQLHRTLIDKKTSEKRKSQATAKILGSITPGKFSYRGSSQRSRPNESTKRKTEK